MMDEKKGRPRTRPVSAADPVLRFRDGPAIRGRSKLTRLFLASFLLAVTTLALFANDAPLTSRELTKAKAAEEQLHAALHASKMEGEWFQLTSEQKEALAQIEAFRETKFVVKGRMLMVEEMLVGTSVEGDKENE